jgi:NAD-dependent deacetylase
MTTLYITGAGVSADSGIPTFRGHDGYWTIGSRNYTPQEMATRAMYLGDPAQFLLWYYRRFAAYRHVQPNAVHRWLAAQCNGGGGSGGARLITQNIDGLDGKAGNEDYISIHGRLDRMTLLHDQSLFDHRGDGAAGAAAEAGIALLDAPWDEVAASLADTGANGLAPADGPADEASEPALIAALLAACRIPRAGPQMGVSLKPYVLLFDEYYTDLYRMTEAEAWMNGASRMVFMGTSFSVNITAIALRVAVQRGIPVEIVDPEPIDLAASFGIPAGMADISYRRMKAQAWVVAQG